MMTMRIRKFAMVAAFVAAVFGGSVRVVHADPVTLNLNPVAIGCAALCNVPTPFDGIDLLPGNALAVAVIPTGAPPPPNQVFQLYFQAVLGTFTLNTLPVYSPTLQSLGEVTAVAGVQATTGAAPGFPTATFNFVPGGNNFFSLYAQNPRNANNLAGTGFNDGTLIMSGTIVSGGGSFTAQTPATNGCAPVTPATCV